MLTVNDSAISNVIGFSYHLESDDVLDDLSDEELTLDNLIYQYFFTVEGVRVSNYGLIVNKNRVVRDGVTTTFIDDINEDEIVEIYYDGRRYLILVTSFIHPPKWLEVKLIKRVVGLRSQSDLKRQFLDKYGDNFKNRFQMR